MNQDQNTNPLLLRAIIVHKPGGGDDSRNSNAHPKQNFHVAFVKQ
jgi:hypothetical protein